LSPHSSPTQDAKHVPGLPESSPESPQAAVVHISRVAESPKTTVNTSIRHILALVSQKSYAILNLPSRYNFVLDPVKPHSSNQAERNVVI
jgi:hypothetical protein